jgi:hypothetical protein
MDVKHLLGPPTSGYLIMQPGITAEKEAEFILLGLARDLPSGRLEEEEQKNLK